MKHKLLLISLFILFAAALSACTDPGATDIATGAPEATAGAEQPAVEPTEAPATPLPAVETATPEPAPTKASTAEPTATAAPAVICPDVPRPALLLSTGTAYELHNPLSGERCTVPLPGEDLGTEFIAGGRIYFLQRDPEAMTLTVSRLNPDGTIEPIPATQSSGNLSFQVQFAVAPDESRLAWSEVLTPEDPNAPGLTSSLWLAAPDGSAPVAVFEGLVTNEFVVGTPIRFSADGQTLFFTWQPIGLGGMWNAFNGRYDNLYRVSAAGGELEKIFDCGDLDLFLCVGDFQDDGTVAYIDTERVIHVLGPDGAEVGTVPTPDDYVGYPTFSPTGDLFYSTALLPAEGTDVVLPAPGFLYRTTAPYTSDPELVASAEGLLTAFMAQPFLDAAHLVASYAESDMWGSALVGTNATITPLEPWPNAYLAAVWPAE